MSNSPENLGALHTGLAVGSAVECGGSALLGTALPHRLIHGIPALPWFGLTLYLPKPCSSTEGMTRYDVYPRTSAPRSTRSGPLGMHPLPARTPAPIPSRVPFSS